MQEGDGKKATARLELWVRCVIEGKVENPVDWDYKTGRLPATPVWADFTGEGVEPPEQGFGPATPLTGSTQNPGADGTVVDAAALQRQLQAQAEQHQRQMTQMLMSQQQLQQMMVGQQQFQPSPPSPQQTTVTTTTTGPGQRPISAFLLPRNPTNAAASPASAGIVAALQDPAVMNAIAMALARAQGVGR